MGFFFLPEKGLSDSLSFMDGEKVQSQKNDITRKVQGKCNISLMSQRSVKRDMLGSFLHVTISTAANNHFLCRWLEDG